MCDVRENNATFKNSGVRVCVVVQQVTRQLEVSSFEVYTCLNRAEEVVDV